MVEKQGEEVSAKPKVNRELASIARNGGADMQLGSRTNTKGAKLAKDSADP